MKDTIVQVGAPVLRQKAKVVPKKEFGTRALGSLIKKMKKVVEAEEYGVAIAAPQLGASVRIFVIAEKVFKEREKSKYSEENGLAEQGEENRGPFRKNVLTKPTIFINPELTRLSRKKHERSEGCLSVRGKYGAVLRHEKATVTAQDEKGEKFTYHGSGLLAHIFQHEVDHLNGILYIDRATHIADEHKDE